MTISLTVIGIVVLVLCIVVCRHYHYKYITTQRSMHDAFAKLSGALGAGIICAFLFRACTAPEAMPDQYITDNTLRFVKVVEITKVTKLQDVLFVETVHGNYTVPFKRGVAYRDEVAVASDNNSNAYLCFSYYIAKSICHPVHSR